MLSTLEQGLEALNIDLPQDAKAKLIQYLELLAKWNQHYNLTAIREPEAMVTKHILDSLVLLPFLNQEKILDVGTGSGVPGVPLSICLTDFFFVLLDSQRKKCNFVQHARTMLQLPHVEVVCDRVESYKPSEGFDWIISRAFSSLDKFIEVTKHLINPGGRWIAMKGKIHQEELDLLNPAYRVEKIIPVQVPGLDEDRHLVFVGEK